MNYGKNKVEATKLKRKMPDNMFPIKYCLWCGEQLIRKRHTLSQWEKLKCCCGSCSSFWAHHQKPLSEMPAEDTERFCFYCDARLIRREDEQTFAWLKRDHCNKSHAAHTARKNKPRIGIIKVDTPEAKAGVFRYTPGSEEFNRIAEQYLTRGF